MPVRVFAEAAPEGATPGASSTRKPVQIGNRRRVAATADAAGLGALLAWQRSPAGGHVAALAFVSEGAAALRIGLLIRQLPDEAQLRVYAPGAAAEATTTGREIKARVAVHPSASLAAAAHWLPAVAGPEAVLEIELPPSIAPQAVQIAVPYVSHLWVAPQSLGTLSTKIGEAGTCNVDATCSPAHADPARSVARMIFVRDGNSFLCTGTLMADAPASGRPFFLTAHHCIADAGAAASLSTYWFYGSSACLSTQLSSRATPVHGGAALRFTSADTDTTLLELNTLPPPGTLYSGSVLGAVPVGIPVTGLHHPLGDLLKLSTGSAFGYMACTVDEGGGTVSCRTSDAQGGTDLAVGWTSGVTEPGSSGSSLFAGIGTRHYVIGQLRGGGSSCSNPTAPDVYGRFDRGYAAGINALLGSPATTSASPR